MTEDKLQVILRVAIERVVKLRKMLQKDTMELRKKQMRRLEEKARDLIFHRVTPIESLLKGELEDSRGRGGQTTPEDRKFLKDRLSRFSHELVVLGQATSDKLQS